jgi:peptidoglycan/xylan/chitin deacetylase (PgdA/CDA1 family)
VPHSGDAPPQSGSPAVPVGEAPLTAPPPLLMYHYIRTVDRQADPLGYNLSIAPALFAAQMEWLHAAGYTGITIDHMLACLQGTALCPLHPIVLTFDDGYQDAYDQALPVLHHYGFTATFYIISGRVGQPGYLTWDELIAMHNAGMEIGSHTINHYNLTALAPLEARRQIVQSKAELEQRLGFPVKDFAYPSGRYNRAIEQQVRAAGYQSAVTTRWDNDYRDVFALPRRRISGGTSVKAFAAIVGGSSGPLRTGVAPAPADKGRTT